MTPSPLIDGTDIAARLQVLTTRLAQEAGRDVPPGMTEPDEGSSERWAAAEVWAHMAEFVSYWHEQLEAVIAEFDGEPVPFGRTKTDPGRIAAIEVGGREPIDELARRAQKAVQALRRRVAALGSAEWNAVGRHETRGEMDAEAIIERFVIAHMEEHLDQLEGLHRGASAG